MSVCVVLFCCVFLVRVVSLVLGCCVLFCLFVCFDVDVFPFAGMIFVFLLFALRFMFADLVASCCFICAVLCWVGLRCVRCRVLLCCVVCDALCVLLCVVLCCVLCVVCRVMWGCVALCCVV